MKLLDDQRYLSSDPKTREQHLHDFDTTPPRQRKSQPSDHEYCCKNPVSEMKGIFNLASGHLSLMRVVVLVGLVRAVSGEDF